MRTLFLILVGALMAGCGDQARITHQVVDGEKRVTVRESRQRPQEVLRITHLYDIDGSNLPSGGGFGRITDIEVSDNGLVYVADAANAQVVVLDISGQYVAHVGQRGPGPSEYRSGPSFIEVDSSANRIVVGERIRLLFFNTNMLFENEIRLHRVMMDVSASAGGIYAILGGQRPIASVTETEGIGPTIARPIVADDVEWKLAKQAIINMDDVNVEALDAQPNPLRLPRRIEAICDSVVVHDLVYRSGIRAWNLRSGAFLWEIEALTDSYEFPTFYRYHGESWEAPMIFERTRTTGISFHRGFLLVGLMTYHKGTRHGPDRMIVDYPGTEQLVAGWDRSSYLQVFSMDPDLEAEVSLGIKSWFKFACTDNGVLLISHENPEPIISAYRLEILWN